MLFSNTLRLESVPLHTERPAIAAQAPAQAEAAYKRGAHVIGFTEVNPHSKVPGLLSALAVKHGYTWIHGGGDTALAIKDRLSIISRKDFVQVSGQRGYTTVTFKFHGSKITVIYQHYATNVPAHHAVREAQTRALIKEMDNASKGKRLAFYMGDFNPTAPLRDKTSHPRFELDHAGLPLVYSVLGFPAGVGVNAIGYNSIDRRVRPKWVKTFPKLGSDHMPIQVGIKIKRRG